MPEIRSGKSSVNMISHIFENFRETQLGGKTGLFLAEILKEAAKRDSVVIFLSRKGYWLYRTFRRYGRLKDIDLDALMIGNDRYIDKWIEPKWNGKTFYIVDDTLTTGMTLYHVFEKVKNDYPDSEVIPTSLFLSVEKDELKGSLESRMPDAQMQYLEDFISRLNSYQRTGASDVGFLSYSQISVFQGSMVPYVIDLPVMIDAQYDTSKPETEGNHPYIVMKKEDFRRLIQSQGAWDFVDNSFQWDDMSGKQARTVKISEGLFRYRAAGLLGNAENVLRQLVIKCRYEALDEDNLAVTFTPFAIGGSASYEEIFHACLAYYSGTEFASWLDKKGRALPKEKTYVLVMRSFVYFVSFYGWKLFERLLHTVSPDINLVVDMDILKENSSQVFVDTVKQIEKWEDEEFFRRLNSFIGIHKMEETPAVYLRKEKKIVGLDDKEKVDKEAYTAIYRRMIDRKRQRGNHSFLPIESLANTLKESMPEMKERYLDDMLSRILTKMLNQSVISNRVAYRDGVIYRGFRYGENSDIALPFYNTYIFWGVEQFYFRCILKSHDLKVTVSDLYFDNIHRFFQGIRKTATDRGYLNVQIDEDDLAYCEEYFSDSRADLDTLVENKWFRLEREYRAADIEDVIDACVKEILG